MYEHIGPRGEAVITGAGLQVAVTWSGLDRLHQWTHPGVGALGIEPANCSVMGRAHDRAEGRLPVLGPGGERTTRLRIAVYPSSENPERPSRSQAAGAAAGHTW